MGKVFVKGPVESPDDLLAKESGWGQAGRLIGGTAFDATQGAVNLTRHGAIQSAADLAGIPFNILRYLANKDWKRKLSPTELAYQKLIAGREAQEQYTREEADRQRQEEMRQNFQRLEGLDVDDDRRIEPLPEISGGIFSQQRRDSKQALADAQAQRLADYERLEAAQRLPLQEDADNEAEEEMYQRNLQRVQEENIRAALRGQKQKGKNQAQVSAGILEMISNANAPPPTNVTNQGAAVADPPPVNIDNLLNPPPPNEELDILTETERENMPTDTMPSTGVTPLIGRADNAGAVAASGGVNSSQASAFKEIDRDEEMINNRENIDFKNETGVEQPKMEPQTEEGPIDFTKPPTNITQDVRPPKQPQNLADVVDQQEGNF